MTDPSDANKEKFVWTDVPCVLDLYEHKFICRIMVTQLEAVALNFNSNHLRIRRALFTNGNRLYVVDMKGLEYMATFSSTMVFNSNTQEKKPLQVAFRFHASKLHLVPLDKTIQDTNGDYILVFIGARQYAFCDRFEYRGQFFTVESKENNETVIVRSDKEIPADAVQLFQLAYSFFQNAEIKLLEYHTREDLTMHVQIAPDPCADLRLEPEVFQMILAWLVRDDCFKTKRNIYSYYFSGARLLGDYTDLKLTYLFLCMNAVCGGGGRFGLNISRHFHISEGDGIWLSYVRNYLVHEGVPLEDAIERAYPEFEENQVPRGKTLERYAKLTEEPVEARSRIVYCDVVNLLYAYFMEETGYPNPFAAERNETPDPERKYVDGLPVLPMLLPDQIGI